jgi:hypothetical protein
MAVGATDQISAGREAEIRREIRVPHLIDDRRPSVCVQKRAVGKVIDVAVRVARGDIRRPERRAERARALAGDQQLGRIVKFSESRKLNFT